MIIKENIINKIEIKKSKFFVFLIKVDDVSLVNSYLNKIKEDYKGANHYCYAYIISSLEKCSDDGEPSGTAGLPILNILKYENLENILCVVVRYFGGIKLGAGGLIRAYASVCKETINLVEKEELIEYVNKVITFSYDELKEIDYIVKDYIVDKIFTDNITYYLKIPIDIYKKINIKKYEKNV